MIYKEVSTKKEFRDVLDNVTQETKTLMEKSPAIGMYQSIYNQLLDIKENIVLKKAFLSREDVRRHYDLGPLAIKNFDIEEELYGRKLVDIYGSIDEYHKYPEND